MVYNRINVYNYSIIYQLQEDKMAKKTSKFVLSKEKREFMVSAIQSYFKNEMDIDLGDLASTLILDFFAEKLASEFYNQGVVDAQKYISEKIEDMLGIQKI